MLVPLGIAAVVLGALVQYGKSRERAAELETERKRGIDDGRIIELTNVKMKEMQLAEDKKREDAAMTKARAQVESEREKEGSA